MYREHNNTRCTYQNDFSEGLVAVLSVCLFVRPFRMLNLVAMSRVIAYDLSNISAENLTHATNLGVGNNYILISLMY